ncbi:TldD/PmbA family protein [Sphingomicrobium lutaoense]|uniref:PmbA protein n=1 Tax=Sphingomicrobium lutaoense TaxID=515949 RepID=A0A839Z1H9_9SPHN|nr:TldD/PmbA family protein [Sphingomicrobium lutaoense]MBB3764418.1 PmbA protein [Sphingomicrobium lutaoense]
MKTPQEARRLAQDLVQRALDAGADAADAAYVASRSSSVEVRDGALEDVSRSEGEKIGLRLFLGSKSASVAASDFSEASQAELVERLMAMAREAPEDPYAGLAPEELLLKGDFPELDLDDGYEPDPALLKERALAAEAALLGVEGVAKSTGASASASGSVNAIATSHGFCGAHKASGHGVSAGGIAGEGNAMERDYDWHSAHHFEDLDDPAEIGRSAGERAIARVGPKRIGGGVMPVLFDPRVASSLLTHLSGAINGAAVARRTSFLKDRMGERVFAEGVDVLDDPLRRRGLRSHGFDGEGLPVKRMKMVEDGVLKSWFAASAAARQLGTAPTGHAHRGSGAPGAGPSNFHFAPGKRSREELMAAYPRMLLVTELIGQGVNMVTGDYSRGAAGFLVENGEIAHPVSEITIASNLRDMFAALEPGSDLELRRGVDAPTVLVPEMTVGSA